MIKLKFLMSLFTMAFAGATFLSCSEKQSGKKFSVSGTLENSITGMIYLEEVPVTNMQPKIVDSSRIGNDGHYSLKTFSKEASVYQLRLEGQMFPLASIINDGSAITLNAKFSAASKEFAESYDVKGSTASLQLKDFVQGFGNRLREIYFTDLKIDSLYKAGAEDSILSGLQAARNKSALELKEFAVQSLTQFSNAALSLYELGYYQATANQNPQLRIEPINNEEISRTINDLAARFPEHQAVAAIKKELDKQLSASTGWVGKTAPEISLPDIKGAELKLSSFRGQYVLVDFWASWCRPCRMENPHVVKAYKQFKEKNFTILGVSLDQDKNAWLKAIKEDGLVWTHISDLKYWNSEVVPLYKIQGIPFNVLVDPSGKVIAENLRGNDLENKLVKVLK